MDKKILLGLTNCIDFEIQWDSIVIKELIKRFGIVKSDLSLPIKIRNEREMLITILVLLASGKGGEFFVEDLEVIKSFANNFDGKISLGGTSFRAGFILSKLGVNSLAHLVNMNPHVKAKIPARMEVVGNFGDEIIRPHLIVQYPGGEDFFMDGNRIISPSPNRIIFVNDINSREPIISNEWLNCMGEANVILISGLNSIQKKNLLDECLSVLKKALPARPKESVAIYEDSGFHNPILHDNVRDTVSQFVDIYSMNEDELSAQLNKSIDLLSVDDILNAYRNIRKILSPPNLLIHTKYWSCIFGPQSQLYCNALSYANLVAATCYKYGYSFSDQQIESVSTAGFNPDGLAFAKALELKLAGAVCCKPALKVETSHPYTVGLGDAFIGAFISKIGKNCFAETIGAEA